MKKLILLISMFASTSVWCQYLEDFNIADQGVDPVTPFTTNLSAVNWSMALGTYVGTVSATPQYAKTVSGALEFRNTDKEVCFTTPVLDISNPPGPRTIAIDFDVTGIDVEDWIQVDYQVNGGTWVPLGNQFGGGTNTVGVTGAAQNANLTGAITASGITGSTLKVRICATSSNTLELLKIQKISVPQTGTVVLPLTWGQIDVRKIDSGNELVWTTYTEINNDYFEIERSIENGTAFESIGRVDGNGNSLSVHEYKFLDKSELLGVSNIYYRIKQVDWDGNFDYSPIVTVKSKTNIKEIAVPNPFRNELTVYLNKLDQASEDIRILNIQGQLINEYEIIEAGEESFTLDTSHLPDGIYFIKFASGNVSRIVKM